MLVRVIEPGTETEDDICRSVAALAMTAEAAEADAADLGDRLPQLDFNDPERDRMLDARLGRLADQRDAEVALRMEVLAFLRAIEREADGGG